jgi:hypothetical protein
LRSGPAVDVHRVTDDPPDPHGHNSRTEALNLGRRRTAAHRGSEGVAFGDDPRYCGLVGDKLVRVELLSLGHRGVALDEVRNGLLEGIRDVPVRAERRGVVRGEPVERRAAQRAQGGGISWVRRVLDAAQRRVAGDEPRGVGRRRRGAATGA